MMLLKVVQNSRLCIKKTDTYIIALPTTYISRNIHLIHAPERIIPGNMFYEIEDNSITVGADAPELIFFS